MTIITIDYKMNDKMKEGNSGRSKVMANWRSSWESMKKDPPVIPMSDIQTPGRSLKVNKSDKKVLNKSLEPKKVVSNENSLKLLLKNNKIHDKTKDRPKTALKSPEMDGKELRSKADLTRIKDKLNQSVNKESISGLTESQTNSNEKNVFLSKLRKRKTDSNSPSVQDLNQTNGKPVAQLKPTNDLIPKSKEVVKENNNKTENGMNGMTAKAVDEVLDTNETCVRSDCNKPINSFYLFEDMYCSADCAVKQWTEDFRNTWGQKNSE